MNEETILLRQVHPQFLTGGKLSSQPDPLPDFPAHAVIDFGKASINECRKLAKRLRAFAVARGCLYSPE